MISERDLPTDPIERARCRIWACGKVIIAACREGKTASLSDLPPWLRPTDSDWWMCASKQAADVPPPPPPVPAVIQLEQRAIHPDIRNAFAKEISDEQIRKMPGYQAAVNALTALTNQSILEPMSPASQDMGDGFIIGNCLVSALPKVGRSVMQYTPKSTPVGLVATGAGASEFVINAARRAADRAAMAECIKNPREYALQYYTPDNDLAAVGNNWLQQKATLIMNEYVNNLTAEEYTAFMREKGARDLAKLRQKYPKASPQQLQGTLFDPTNQSEKPNAEFLSAEHGHSARILKLLFDPTLSPEERKSLLQYLKKISTSK